LQFDQKLKEIIQINKTAVTEKERKWTDEKKHLQN